MAVIATAGHVDHGKSTLVHALTGMQPDRWEEEQRRELTIDLGYAWTTLDSGVEVAFVDVPGHRRFIGNMLAGLGPSPAVMMVVAADAGWSEQSEEHLVAIDGLQLEHGLLVVTRSDLADPAPALAQAQARLARSSLGAVPALAVSATTGAGIPELRAALDTFVAGLPPADPQARIRLWVDRAFTVRGAGTVITGTLSEGTLSVGDELDLRGRSVRVRGLQSMERDVERIIGPARVAINLRGAAASEVHRGYALLSPHAWRRASEVDARIRTPDGMTTEDLPRTMTLHIGTSAASVHVRPLDEETARLRLIGVLPLTVGDHALLRDPGADRSTPPEQAVLGAVILDADPPPLKRRGAGRRRGAELKSATGVPDLHTEVTRRGAVLAEDLAVLGIPTDDANAASAWVRREGRWLVATATWERWASALLDILAAQALDDPLDPALSLEAARAAVGVPDVALVTGLAAYAGCPVEHGRVTARPDPSGRGRRDLGPAEPSIAELERRLTANPFDAPERPELDALRLGPREIAAAVRAGRLLRLAGEVLLLPTAPIHAWHILTGLVQPFTTSAARQALGTTRRVAIPLLEYLDEHGWTRRIDAAHREVIDPGPAPDTLGDRTDESDDEAASPDGSQLRGLPSGGDPP